VAIGLDFERSSIGATSSARRLVDDLVSELRLRRGNVKPELRHRLAEHHIAVQVLRTMAYNIARCRGAGWCRHAKRRWRSSRRELQQKIGVTALQVFGMEGQASVPGSRALHTSTRSFGRGQHD